MKIDKKFIRKWVVALRSGKYHQTKYALCNVEKGQSFHCCLGVACRVAIKNGLAVTTRNVNEDICFEYKGTESSASLPLTLREKIGLSNELEAALINMNDNCDNSFKEIADSIERQLL